MSRIGIQFKPDHPAMRPIAAAPMTFSQWRDLKVPEQRTYTAGQVGMVRAAVHEIFRCAYGLPKRDFAEMLDKGIIEITQTDDGSLWVWFVSELDQHEAGLALSAMRRFG